MMNESEVNEIPLFHYSLTLEAVNFKQLKKSHSRELKKFNPSKFRNQFEKHKHCSRAYTLTNK